MSRLGDTSIPKLAANLVYTLNRGQGAYTRNGTSAGDGFSYRVVGDQLFVTGAKEEALVDTGTQLHHYTLVLSGQSMTWSIASPGSPTGQKVMYVFEKQ